MGGMHAFRHRLLGVALPASSGRSLVADRVNEAIEAVAVPQKKQKTTKKLKREKENSFHPTHSNLSSRSFDLNTATTSDKVSTSLGNLCLEKKKQSEEKPQTRGSEHSFIPPIPEPFWFSQERRAGPTKKAELLLEEQRSREWIVEYSEQIYENSNFAARHRTRMHSCRCAMTHDATLTSKTGSEHHAIKTK